MPADDTQEAAQERVPGYSPATIEFGVPDVPYSKVTVHVNEYPSIDEAVESAVYIAASLRQAMLAEWQHLDPDAVKPEPQQRPRPSGEAYARPQQARPQQARGSAPQRGGGGRGGAPIAYCPEHDDAPVFLSPPQYNRDGDKCFHYLDPDDKRAGSHSIYWRLTVDEDGNSNADVPIPSGRGGGRGGARRAPARQQYGGDYYLDDESF